MKRLLGILCILCSMPICCQAQAYIDSAMRFKMSAMSYQEAMQAKSQLLNDAAPSDTGEGSTVGAFLKRAVVRQAYTDPYTATGGDLFSSAHTAYLTSMTTNNYCLSSAGGNWKCLGPFKRNSNTHHDNQGRVDAVWIDPNDSLIILAGTYGGLWKTTNGGQSWHNISDNHSTGYGSSDHIPGTMGVIELAVNPIDNNVIYIFMASWSGIGTGAAYTTDGGATWRSDPDFNTLIGYNVFDAARATPVKMGYMPGTQILFASMGQKVIIKPSPAASWYDVSPALDPDTHITDMEFTWGTPQSAVFSTSAYNGTAKIFSCDSTGYSWTTNDISMPVVTDSLLKIEDISLTAADSIYMLLDVKGKKQHLAKAFPLLSNAEILDTDITGGATDKRFESLVVSPNNTSVIYFTSTSGTQNVFMTKNRGVSLANIMGNTHPDGRYITLYNSAAAGDTLGDVLFCGTDGGVVKKRYLSDHMESITGDSLCITNFFGLGNTDADDAIIAAGAVDNGVIAYNAKRSIDSRWAQRKVGDGGLTRFLRNGSLEAYSQNLFPDLLKIVFSPTTEAAYEILRPSDSCSPLWWAGCNAHDRQWHVDPSNNVYVGYSRVWKQDFGTSTWSPAFSNVFPLSNDNKYIVRDIYVDDNNPSFAYIAYKGKTRNDTILTDKFNPFGKLFVSDNANSTTPGAPPEWRSITPSAVGWMGIADIEVDPDNPLRMWVGLEGTHEVTVPRDSASGRVLYTVDSGAHWIDVSTGLPPLPVNRIKFRHGSKGEVYCATALGTYKCDFAAFDNAATWHTDGNNYRNRSVKWECFNEGMPICDVTDMEFNYCGNKLRICTRGRGIWETELQSPMDIVEDGIEINTNTTWEQDRYLPGGITVKPGKTLTIKKCTVHMPRNGAIRVEPGAKLVVDSATITNNCDGSFWYGIEAIGNPSLSQTGTNQGWVVIRNQSVIEHARFGVTNCDHWNDPMGTTGGVIQVIYSSFLNNHNSVTMMPYHAPGALTPPNLSYFRGVNFMNDATYRGFPTGYYMKYHVDLKEVDGIQFSGCQFINRDWRRLGIGDGVGINALNASFKVEPRCAALDGVGGCLDLRRSYFCGLDDGIAIKDAIGLGASVSIDQADFDSVSVGVFVSAQNNVSVTRSKFIVGRGNVIDSAIATMNSCGNVGVAMLNTPTFKLEGNTFLGRINPTSISYSSWYNYGAVIANTGAIVKKIYRNKFDSLTEGVRSIGNNRSSGSAPPPLGPGGLQILCNDFTANGTDIVVVKHGSASPQGIGPEIGWSGKPAKNTFTASVTNITNAGLSFTYHYDNASPSTDMPVNVSPSVFRIGSSNGSSCASTIPTGSTSGGGTFMTTALNNSVLSTHKTAFFASRQQRDSLVGAFNGLLDLGSTEELEYFIDTVTSANTLYDALISISPYLSPDALLYGVSSPLLSYDEMDSVLTRNPEVLRYNGILEFILDYFRQEQDNNPQLPDYVSHIDSVANTAASERSVFEAEIFTRRSEVEDHHSAIMFALKSPLDTNVSVTDTTGEGICTDSASIYFSLDSNTYYYGLDSLEAWLHLGDTVNSIYDRIGYNVFRNQFSQADVIFNTIIRSALPKEHQPAYDSYKDFWNVLVDVHNEGGSIYNLKEADIEALDTFTDFQFSYNRSKQILWNLSTHIRDYIRETPSTPAMTTATLVWTPYKFLCVLSLGESARSALIKSDIADRFTSKRVGKKPGSFVTAYPNPSTGVVTFEYHLPDYPKGAASSWLTVTSILGEKVMEWQVNDRKGAIRWNSEKLASGMYVYQLRDDAGNVVSGKLVFTK